MSHSTRTETLDALLGYSWAQELIELRRSIHREPEISGQEARTAAKILEAIDGLDLSVRTGVAGHGIVVDLDGALPGPTIAFRSDMDALPILEESSVEYCSRVPGVMHACGHDVHTAIGVGLVRSLYRSRDRLHGRVRFIFQPAEEAAAPPGEVIGAEAMCRQGVLEGVETILGLHVLPTLDVGNFAMTYGAVCAASDIFDIRLYGKMAHGAYPHKAIDTVHMTATLIPTLLAIPSRRIEALSPCVLSIGKIRAGETHNVIPGEANIVGILRTFDEELRGIAKDAICRTVQHTATAFGGRGEVKFTTGAKGVQNDEAVERWVTRQLTRSAGADHFVDEAPHMGAEDFASFSSRIPGCFFWLGVRNEERGIEQPVHTPGFDVDERCIPFAVHHIENLLLETGERWTEVLHA